MTHMLDTSAWLAHLFGEPGVEEVSLLFDEPQNDVYVSVLSLLEMVGRLKALNQQDQWPLVRDTYAKLFAKILPVDESIAGAAIEFRRNTPSRLPTIDALIAATASVHGLILVHRDPHLAAIPDLNLSQLLLPGKQA